MASVVSGRKVRERASFITPLEGSFFLKKAASRDSVSYNSNETKISTVVPTDVFARINI